MIKCNEWNNENKIDNYKNKELILLDKNLSSDEKRIINNQNKNSNLILESLNDIKSKKKPKKKYKKGKNQYKYISNYSFSNKTSGNELSRIHFESLEKETLDFEEETNKKSIKKDIPIYINHSDYFYCPNSIKEKNLNIQIIKYLLQNNLIKNNENIKMIQKSKNNKDKIIKNNSFKLEKGINLKLDNNPINVKIENDIIKDNNDSIFLNPYKQDNYGTVNKKKFFDIMTKKNCNQDYLKQIENNKINNLNIQYINNIKNNNNRIYTIENINKIDKPKENFYTFRTGKIIGENNNIIKLSPNNNIISDSSSSPKKLMHEKIKKNKNKNKKKKNLIPISSNKINISKYSKIIYKENKDNYIFNNIKEEYKIIPKVVNIQINEENKNKRNNSCDISVITLQSINDSKMLELADNFIPKDEELEKFRANEIIKKRNHLAK